ncbi:MAG: (2Fe-2S)-binding protein [Desulfatirhabdiaceae bacterium]
MKIEMEPNNRNSKSDWEITRRGFLKTVGSGATIAVTSGILPVVGTAMAAEAKPEEVVRVNLLINSRQYRLMVEARWSLLYVLREKIGLTGSKVGCERGECGACTVLINGIPRYACMTLAVEAEGSEIVTVEGLMDGERLGPVQQAFAEQDAFQCGYCTPGQVMAAEGLLHANPAPEPDEIRRGMAGNICRCGAYTHIVKAVARAAELKQGK